MKKNKIFKISSKIISVFTRIELYLSYLFLILIFFVVGCEVIGRYFFNSPIFWSNEACVLLHTYVICFGYAVIYINKKDIYLLVVYNAIPKGKQWILDLAAEATILLFTLMMLYLSIRYFTEHGDYIAGGLGIPQGLFSFPIIITNLSLVLSTLFDLFKMATKRNKTEGEKEAHIIV